MIIPSLSSHIGLKFSKKDFGNREVGIDAPSVFYSYIDWLKMHWYNSKIKQGKLCDWFSQNIDLCHDQYMWYDSVKQITLNTLKLEGLIQFSRSYYGLFVFEMFNQAQNYVCINCEVMAKIHAIIG